MLKSGAGEYEEAEQRFQQLMKNNPSNVDVIAGFAEAKYAQDKLRAAAPLYDRIIKFGERGTRTYWNAWMQRSRISDELIAEMKQSGEPKKVQAAEEASRKLHSTIRRLEETQDRNLGGEPFKSELTRLRIKHAPR